MSYDVINIITLNIIVIMINNILMKGVFMI